MTEGYPIADTTADVAANQVPPVVEHVVGVRATETLSGGGVRDKADIFDPHGSPEERIGLLDGEMLPD